MTPSTNTLHLITYNIRLGIQEGLEAVAAVLKHAPQLDIVAIQEIGDAWQMGPPGDSISNLARLLELEHFVHVPAIEEETDEGSLARYGHALLSRWPLQYRTIVPLPQFDDEPRALLQVEVDTPHGAVEIVSTHLSHKSSDRPRQGQFLIDWLETHRRDKIPRFLIGDLNAPPSEDWIATLLSIWEDADGDENRPTFPAADPTHRIDYILGQLATCVSSNILDETKASDHRPLITEWEI